MISPLEFVLLGGLFLIAVHYWFTTSSSVKPPPPGPPPLPIIGNLLQLRAAGLPMEEVFAKWAQIYGDVMLVTLPGRPMVILNTVRVAKDLLTKRGAIYSDRPPMILHMELAGWTRMTVGLSYGEQIRAHRRIIISMFNPKTIQKYAELQESGALQLVEALSKTPNEFVQHFSRYVANTVIQLAYGQKNSEQFLDLAHKSMESTNSLGIPSTTIVDMFPFLKHTPIWMPFVSFRKNAEKVRQIVRKAHDVPFNLVKAGLRNGTATSSLVADNLLARGGLEKVTENEEEDIKSVAASLLAAALDTTVAVLNGFVLAMVLHPKVFKKAQSEIDTVIGTSRLPSFDDMASLPYLDAVIRELHRWGGAKTLAIPHKLMQDDMYEGCLLPGGAIVIPNVYAMLRACPDPDSFLPERYIDNISLGEVPADPRDLVFGFGRRRCPGEHLANRSVYIALARMIAVFDISPEKDSYGNARPPPAEFVSGGPVRHPKPFNCLITIRSSVKDSRFSE
ncbi:cytochrome P450 [Armillaria gallica]|uniref:Cytochrome P450 n=1 Tax=Armillaria gallica TaxID=47427 RepID=A0A2H3E971_ARMGA|nr:cytochrome P450 [Armillaria gallica]